jgi:hypothetical protein
MSSLSADSHTQGQSIDSLITERAKTLSANEVGVCSPHFNHSIGNDNGYAIPAKDHRCFRFLEIPGGDIRQDHCLNVRACISSTTERGPTNMFRVIAHA